MGRAAGNVVAGPTRRSNKLYKEATDKVGENEGEERQPNGEY